MSELLDLAVKAHGGLDRWNKVKAIKVVASITGGIWYVKSKGDFLGGATGLNYASDYRNVEGIIVPTKRRVYAYEGDYQLVKEPLLVAIDMGEITLI